MKIWVLGLLVLLGVVLIGIYVFIPSTIILKTNQHLKINSRSFSRNITDEKKWHHWWPQGNSGMREGGVKYFQFNQRKYWIIEKKLTSIMLLAQLEKDSLRTELFFIPVNEDSITLSWVGITKMPLNPIKRVNAFFATQSLRNEMDSILQSLQTFYTNNENLYEVPIKNEGVLDSVLISTTTITKQYPAVKDIYVLVSNLEQFAKKNGAKPSGVPMLHVSTTDSLNYFTRVALPVDKKLNSEGAIEYKWMLGGGDILVAEVKGGPYSINKGFKEMEHYVQDHRLTAPAIPFQSLVTDRRKERDTSKWITRLNWPVM